MENKRNEFMARMHYNISKIEKFETEKLDCKLHETFYKERLKNRIYWK